MTFKMARPKIKKDLLTEANIQYEKLIDMINSINEPDQEKQFTFDVANEKETHWKRDKNIRDILIHLYEWHQLLINWVECNIKGIERQFLLEPYTWKSYGDMNVEFWNKHQNTSYSDSKKMLNKSHKEVMTLIEKISDKELFERDVFKWVGGSTLGQYCVSATIAHYEWAMKKLKKHIKTL